MCVSKRVRACVLVVTVSEEVSQRQIRRKVPFFKTHAEQFKKFVAQFLDEVHVGNGGENQLFDFLRKGSFGEGEPSPVVRISAPFVGMLEGEGETVVDRGEAHALRAAVDLEQPVLDVAVGVADDVVFGEGWLLEGVWRETIAI